MDRFFILFEFPQQRGNTIDIKKAREEEVVVAQTNTHVVVVVFFPRTGRESDRQRRVVS